MAGIEGFEPPIGDSESPALPLGDIPKQSASIVAIKEKNQ